MRFVKDRFFSGLFNFTSSKAWIYISLIFSVEIMNALGIKGQDVMPDGVLFLGLIVLFIGLPLFFNLKYFREIQDNMSREQFDDWKRTESFVVPDKFHIPLYWLGVIVTCVVSVGLAVAYNFVFLVFIPLVLVASFFVWVFVKTMRERKETSLSIAEMKNAMAEYESDMEARYGIHYKKWMLSFIGFSIGMLPVMMFLGEYALLFSPIYFGVLIFILKKAHSKFSGQIEFGGNRGGGVGGFRAPSPLKESDWRDREQEKRYDAKREWESKHWD